MTTENVDEIKKLFNDVINFALDNAGDDGLIFLNLWREGDFNAISEVFPDYQIPAHFIGNLVLSDLKKVASTTFK